MKTRKFRVSFLVEVNASALLSDTHEAGNQVQEMVSDLIDGRDNHNTIVDSFNYEADEEK